MNQLPPDDFASQDDSERISAPGWEAIDQALIGIYPKQQAQHFGTIISYAMGGPDPLNGISIYESTSTPTHRHLITFGFSDLFEKTTEDPEVSGFGFELTFRLAGRHDPQNPPNWAMNFLQNLGRYVFETGNVFGPGHTMPLNGPICGDSDTKIEAITFVEDPELPPIATPNGQVTFLQIVGLTLDELEAVERWNAREFCKLRAKFDPKLVTDIDRDSWLKDPAFAEAVAEGTRRDGSSSASLYTPEVTFKPASNAILPPTIVVPAIAAASLAHRLAGRIPFGREFELISEKKTILFTPGNTVRWEMEEDQLTITLNSEAAMAISHALAPKAGKFSIPAAGGLIFEVQRTTIRDQKGNVKSVIG